MAGVYETDVIGQEFVSYTKDAGTAAQDYAPNSAAEPFQLVHVKDEWVISTRIPPTAAPKPSCLRSRTHSA